MTYLSLIEKLKILFSSIFDFKGIFIFTLLIIVFSILYFIKKINRKRYILSMILSLILMFLISLLSNIKTLSKTFDNFMTIFFSGIYFPSIYVYIGIILIVAVSLIISLLNKKMKKIYKIVNSVMFILNSIIFSIILNIIAKNKIDVFSPNSLFTNINLVAILELTTGLFILWILSIIGIYTINYICSMIESKKKVSIKENVIEEVVSEIKEANNQVEITITKDNTKDIAIENNKEEVVSEIKETNSKVEATVIEDNNTTFNDLLNSNIKIKYYKNKNKNAKEEYNISNPQEFYENNYLNIKTNLDDNSNIEIMDNSEIDVLEDNIVSIEDITNKIKLDNAKENSTINTVSLNDLINVKEVIEVEQDVKEVERITKNNDKYTLEDYKKILSMLKEIRNSNVKNITVDEAVTLSLFKDYSIDDCLKFKDILESNLN